MSILTAAVVVALVVTVANLLLMLGVIRKLREYDRVLAGTAPVRNPDPTVPVGSVVPAVSASTVDGGVASSVHAAGPQLIGFFSPGCKPCADLIPGFTRHLAATGLAGLAVVVADAGDNAEHVAALAGHVDIVVEPTGGALSTALEVTSFPALCLVAPDGTVLGSGNVLSDLPQLVAA